MLGYPPCISQRPVWVSSLPWVMILAWSGKQQNQASLPTVFPVTLTSSSELGSFLFFHYLESLLHIPAIYFVNIWYISPIRTKLLGRFDFFDKLGNTDYLCLFMPGIYLIRFSVTHRKLYLVPTCCLSKVSMGSLVMVFRSNHGV